LQFCSVDNPVEQRCLLVSACHGTQIDIARGTVPRRCRVK
jgi:hypothetical protein